ncbi:MAG TPA: hypothetical protein VFC63_12700 [Blastocatellia bacterium]|nr:hypothetical protein [Blastocatellia bacterium]
MTASKLLTLTVFLICTVLVCQGYQEANKGKESFWLNLPDCPMTIRLSSNKRHMEISNDSSKKIIGYQLAYVVVKGTATSILMKMDPEKADLASRDNHGAWIYAYDDYGKFKSHCEQNNVKLSVIRVSFADGTIWEFANGI